MPNYKPYNYAQMEMVVINYQDQLQPGTFEYAINYLIEEELDLSIFDQRYNNDQAGRPAYHPAILLKVILFAYSKGITSSREIESCCRYHIIFQALTCGAAPHFTTIAHFISTLSAEIEGLFEQILLICDAQGLLGKELFAIDGCKMSSNASKEWSGTFEELKQKRDKLRGLIRYHTKAHQERDRRQDTKEDQVRTEQTIQTLKKHKEKIDSFLKTQIPRIGNGKRPKEVKSNITDNESAKMKTSKGTIQGYNGVASADSKHQIIVDAQAFGEGQEHHTLAPVLETIEERFRKIGISEELYQENLIVTADTGFANEANMKYLHEHDIDAYIPDNQFRQRDDRFTGQKRKYGKRNQDKPKKDRVLAVIPSSEFHIDAERKRCVCPAGEEMWLKAEKDDGYGNHKLYFEGRLSKCRTCALLKQCMRNPDSPKDRKGHGRQVSFIVNRDKRVKYTDWMKKRVDSEKGKQIYSKRMSIVEPVFANIGSTKGLNRFSLRGKQKVDTQWKLYCLVHNIEKINNYGCLAA